MEGQATVPIDVLDDDEAWALFRMKAELDERVSRDIVEEAKKVAEECKGLRVAIVTLASALKGTKTRDGWELARKTLESNRLIESERIKPGDKNAYACIKTSYEYLKKETTKRCFLFCALYPENHSIDAEDLVRYAWGLELYGKTDSIEEVRIQVLEAIDYLKDSCLLLQVKDGGGYGDNGRHVKLHNMVRDVALWIASNKESGFTIKSGFGLLNDSLEPCKAISLLDRERKNISEKLVCPELEFMLLNNCVVHGLCFLGMQELKVLSLSVEPLSERIVSLYPLQFLGKLRSLHLENFEDFSFLGNIRTLEIFSLRGSIFESFVDELRKLENLKVLDLADSRFSKGFPGDVIRRLSKLEELYLTNMEGESTAIFQEINFLTRLTTLSLAASSLHLPKNFKFPELKRCHIFINKHETIFFRRERRLQVERSLYVDKFYLNPVSQLLEKIESLVVKRLEDECLIVKRPKVSVRKMLQNLKEVSISDCGNLKVVFGNVEENDEPVCSDLRLLYLENLPKLSHIWELPIQHVRLEALVDLKICKCPSLKSLFPISLAQSLALLENLDISYCGELKQIVTESGEISSSIGHPNSLCFPKLRKVHIKECDGLEYIFPTLMAPQGLPQLESLCVSYCRRLKQLVRRTEMGVVLQQMQFSKPLTEFSVSGCPLLRNSFLHLEAEEAHLEGIPLSTFSGSFSCRKHLQLCRITEYHNVVPEANKDGLNGLTSLEVESCQDLECLVDTTTGNGPTSSFNHLEKLKISHSRSLKTLSKGQPPQGFLKNLKQLTFEDCYKLQVVFQMGDLTCNGEHNQEKPLSNLQSLNLFKLHELRWIFKGSSHSFSLQCLKVVNIEKCGKLESLFSPSLIQSLVMLEQLRVSKCDGLKTLIAELENNDGEAESNTSLPTLLLPKLAGLCIRDCRELQYALPITSAKGLPALAAIEVSGCSELKQVFGSVKEHNGVEQDGIVHLGNLRHLGLCSLSNLSCFAPENYIFKAPALESLNVDDCPLLMNFAISQVNKELHFTSAGSSSNRWETLESLVHATQKAVSLCTDFLENTRKLKVKDFKQMQEVLRNDEENQAQSLLSNVEQLKLESLRELRWIVKVPTHSVTFQSLLVLTIDGCDQLVSLFPLSAIRTVRSLQRLTIANCYKLKSVFMELGKIESSSLYLPNLKTVDISACHNAEYVFPLALAGGLACLQEIRLCDLENLRSVFAEINIVEAPALEILEVVRCPRFRSFIIRKEANNSVSFKVLDLRSNSRKIGSIPLGQIRPGLESLTMGNFKQLFHLEGGNSISNLEHLHICHMIWVRDIWKGPIRSAMNLRKLKIDCCDALTYIFPMTLIQYLPHLKSLSIEYCEKLKQIIAIDDSSSSSSPFEKRMEFPQLEEMELYRLPRLVSFSPLGYHLVFPSLNSFKLTHCYKMITSFMVDYLTMAVHAKTEKAPPLGYDIEWNSRNPFEDLSQYVEEDEEMSTLN